MNIWISLFEISYKKQETFSPYSIFFLDVPVFVLKKCEMQTVE